jgi:DNA-binding HxlR family transcriptional regulator
VLRTVYPVVPPKVEYQLTDLGQSLLTAIQSIVTWTVSHLPELATARAAYDARQDEGGVGGEGGVASLRG